MANFLKNIKYYMLKTKSISAAVMLMSAYSLLNLSSVTAIDSSSLAYSLHLYNSINSYRAKHTVPALRWDRQLTESAEKVAAGIVAESSLNVESPVGITLFVNPEATRPPASLVAATWYNESVHYNYNNPIYNRATHNFTQMIWKASTSVGIGSFTHAGYTSVVAIFRPAGNIRDSFRQNVTPRKQPTGRVYKKPRFRG